MNARMLPLQFLSCQGHPDSCACRLRALEHEMHAAILLPRVLVMAEHERALLPVADRAYTVGGDAGGDQVVPHRLGTAVPQPEVVLSSAALVAVALEEDPGGRVGLQPARVFVQDGLLPGVDHSFVVLEEDVLQWRCAGGSRASWQ